MGKPAFTPGPWKVSVSEPPGEYLIHAPGSPWVLGYFVAGHDGAFPMGVNARLAAAAPDLYEALNACLGLLTGNMDGDLPSDRDPYDMARAALAKAEGRQP